MDRVTAGIVTMGWMEEAGGSSRNAGMEQAGLGQEHREAGQAVAGTGGRAGHRLHTGLGDQTVSCQVPSKRASVK